MDWNAWEPHYRRIAADLGLDPEADRRAAELLASLLPACPDCISMLESLLRGRVVAVFGPALAPAVPDVDAHTTIIAAGSAVGPMAELGLRPNILVTDLDGDIDAHLDAAREGALAVIHGHGDNMPALKRWVPEFTGHVMGTTQVEPLPGVHNFGGFTDGDRAVFMALHFGARRILLPGWDLDRPVPRPGMNMAMKSRKLRHARSLLDLLVETAGPDVIAWPEYV